jgi:coenzyme F420-reducing hydrogenase alpha subunit
MTPGGTLAAEIVTREGRVAEARIVSSRRVPLAAALRGKRVSEAVTLVPLLFATCGIAHGLAASSAARSARGEGADEGEPSTADLRRLAWARALLVASEVIDGHAWSLLVDWPRVLGGPPQTENVRALRGATAALRDAVDPARASLRLDAGTVAPSHEGLARALAELDARVAALAGDLPHDAHGLESWARTSGSPAAPFVRYLLETGNARFGGSDVALLPELDARWFAARLSADAAFGERPTLDGAPCEAGPIARAAASPLVASVIGTHGRGALARLAARLVELASAPARVRATVASGEATELAAHDGCGVADTARGRLAHWALVERDVVVDWRFVAPTEWTFHPDGAFPRGLVGARALGDELAQRVQLHVAALDPCVPCEISLREAANAAG